MTRRFYLLMIIVGMFFLSSCTNASNTNKKEDAGVIKQSTDYSSMFESVALKDTTNYKLQRITIDGAIIQTLGDHKVLLKKASDLIVYDSKEKKETTLLKDIWNPIVSKDKTIVAYENEEGLHVLNLKSKKSTLVYKLENEISRNFIISNDNKYILLQTIKDEKFYTRLIEMNGKSKKVTLQENDDFVLTKLIYFGNNKLFASAEVKKDNYPVKDEELIKTTDIVMIDLNTNRVKNITDMTPEDQTYLLDLYEDEILLEMVQQKFNGENLTEKYSVKRISLKNGTLYNTNIKLEDRAVLKVLSNEKEYFYLEQPKELDIKYPDESELKFRNNRGKISTIGTIYTDVPSVLFVQDNAIYFKSNGDIYIITIVNR